MARLKSSRTVTLLHPHVVRTKGASTGVVYEFQKGVAVPVPEEDLKPMLRKWARTPFTDRPRIAVLGKPSAPDSEPVVPLSFETEG